MKIITENSTDTINIKDINPEEHIIVMIQESGRPGLLTANKYKGSEYSFKCLNHETSIGNAWGNWPVDFHTSVEETILHQLDRGSQVHTFPNSDWKQALQFLIDNCK